MEEKKKREVIVDISDISEKKCKIVELGWESLDAVSFCRDETGKLSVHPIGEKRQGKVKIEMEEDPCPTCR